MTLEKSLSLIPFFKFFNLQADFHERQGAVA